MLEDTARKSILTEILLRIISYVNKIAPAHSSRGQPLILAQYQVFSRGEADEAITIEAVTLESLSGSYLHS